MSNSFFCFVTTRVKSSKHPATEVFFTLCFLRAREVEAVRGGPGDVLGWCWTEVSFGEDIEVGGASAGQSKGEVPSVGAKACPCSKEGC